MVCQEFNPGRCARETDQPLVKLQLLAGIDFKRESVVKFHSPGHLLDLKMHSISSPGKVCFDSGGQVATDTKY